LVHNARISGLESLVMPWTRSQVALLRIYQLVDGAFGQVRGDGASAKGSQNNLTRQLAHLRHGNFVTVQKVDRLRHSQPSFAAQ